MNRGRTPNFRSSVFHLSAPDWIDAPVRRSRVSFATDVPYSASTYAASFCFFQAEDGIRYYKVTGGSDVCSSDLAPVISPLTGLESGSTPRCPSGDSRLDRSEERRVGKEGRSRWSPYHLKKKKKKTATNSNIVNVYAGNSHARVFSLDN